MNQVFMTLVVIAFITNLNVLTRIWTTWKCAKFKKILGVTDHPSFKTSVKKLNFTSEVKVEVVEIKLDKIELLSSLYSPRSSRKNRVKKLLECYGFKYFFYASCIGVNLASLNPNIRRASEKLIAKAVGFAHEINAELVVAHVVRLSKIYPIRESI